MSMPLIRVERVGPAPFIALDVAGAGDLVVLLHGIGGNKRNWRDNIGALGRHFQVAAWDARGWGASDDYEGPLTFEDMSQDLLRVMDHLGHRRAHIVGLSMGGRIAMHFAVHHPDRVGSLVLCDTTQGPKDWPEERRTAFIQSRQAPLLSGKTPADIAEQVATSLVSPDATAEARAQLVESLSMLHKDSYLKAIEANVADVILADLSLITVPTLVMVGEDDRLTPPEEAQEIAGLIARARLHVIERAGHLINIEAPTEFNEQVLAFLLEQPATNTP